MLCGQPACRLIRVVQVQGEEHQALGGLSQIPLLRRSGLHLLIEQRSQLGGAAGWVRQQAFPYSMLKDVWQETSKGRSAEVGKNALQGQLQPSSR